MAAESRGRIGTIGDSDVESGAGSGERAPGILYGQAQIPSAQVRVLDMPSDPDPDYSDELIDADGDGDDTRLESGLGSGLLAQQPTPSADEAVTVARVCPQCGAEYETGDRFCPKDGTPLRPKSGGDPLVGKVIAERYLVLARLGEGGMGRVYLAEHVKMNRQCAIKVMNPSLIHDAESLHRFAREASSAARILHPNVAAVFDYGEADKIVYLVMEYVDGESLSAIIAKDGNAALDPRRAIDLARQIADGLHAAHELGIVHRDLKPDNVIVARSKGGKEIPKIVDFGIAKAMTESPQDALTRSGLVIGTPEYMSPEQLLGDPVDARADIYSLGCILYQMLTGEAAFAAESREQMIRRRLHEPPPHIRDVMPDLPRRLDTLIVHMLARSSADRLASAADARDALDPALALGGWDPGSISGAGPLAMVNGRPDDPSLRPTVAMTKVTTSPKRIAIGAVIGSVLLLAGMASWNEYLKPPKKSAPAAVVDIKPTAPPVTPAASPPAKATLTPNSDTATKPKPVVPVDPFDALLKRVADALSTGKIAEVSRVFPEMTTEQRTGLESFFARASQIHAGVRHFKPDATNNSTHAEGTFSVTLNYVEKNTLAKGSYPVSYHAVFNVVGGKWTLTNLTAPKAP